MQNQAYTLSQFQTLLGDAIRMSRTTQNVWVTAEFSDLRVVGGHCYMELLEKDASGRTVAKIRAMIWSNTLHPLNAKFKAVTNKDIASGMKVMVRGSATHHNLYGISFTINDINPEFTLGDLERLRAEILAQLAREGIADRNRRLTPPATPQRVAVISSDGAAGYGDFMNQLTSNSEGFRFYPVLFQATMQGDRTAGSVIAALDLIEATQSVAKWDAVAIIRGGGSTTDLNGFDNLELARRVATCPLPVLVGIGHERDRNVLDELACVRCKTPTAVAAWMIESMRMSWTRACDIVNRIARYGSEAMKGESIRLANYGQLIPAVARTRLMEHKMRLSGNAQRIPALVQGRVMRQRMQLSQLASRIELTGHNGIATANALLDRLSHRLTTAAATASERESLRLRRIEDMLRILSPANTLRRGYSITRVDGHAVTDPSQVAPGATVETTLAGGKIISTAN
ncbi:MAG: exodeoxyribonuclease VII large subunit [Muribaculaceae bacterium]|nr:exodeoxyribonuclease VII large subunit [Muribaculaceae bacterium]